MQSQKRKRSPSDEFKKEPTKESKKKKTPDTSSTDLDSTLSRSARGLRANSKKKKPLEEVDKNKTTSITAKNKVEHWLNATNGQTANTTLNFNEKESVANLLKKPCLSTFNINNQSHDLNSLLTLEGSSATSSKAISSAELDLKSGNNHNNNNNTKHSKKLVNKQLESTKLDSKFILNFKLNWTLLNFTLLYLCYIVTAKIRLRFPTVSYFRKEFRLKKIS